MLLEPGDHVGITSAVDQPSGVTLVSRSAQWEPCRESPELDCHPASSSALNVDQRPTPPPSNSCRLAGFEHPVVDRDVVAPPSPPSCQPTLDTFLHESALEPERAARRPGPLPATTLDRAALHAPTGPFTLHREPGSTRRRTTNVVRSGSASSASFVSVASRSRRASSPSPVPAETARASVPSAAAAAAGLDQIRPSRPRRSKGTPPATGRRRRAPRGASPDPDRIFVRQVHHEHERTASHDMAQEAVAESSALARPLDQSRDVGDDEAVDRRRRRPRGSASAW